MSFLDFRPEGHPTTRCPQLKGLRHDTQLRCPVGQAFVRKVPRSLFHYALGQGQNDYGDRERSRGRQRKGRWLGPESILKILWTVSSPPFCSQFQAYFVPGQMMMTNRRPRRNSPTSLDHISQELAHQIRYIFDLAKKAPRIDLHIRA